MSSKVDSLAGGIRYDRVGDMGNLTVLGLSGGVGSGKSTVASLFRELGAEVMDADRMAHECLAWTSVREALVREFGPAVLDSEGRVDRARLAGQVFADEALREQLNRIIHPEVGRMIRERLEALRTMAPERLVVLDVPLLFESGLDALCDQHLFVDTPIRIRDQRVRTDRGWEPDERKRREKTQKSIEEKRAIADYKIDNAGALALLRARVRAIFQELSP